jgi:hypothetical protein
MAESENLLAIAVARHKQEGDGRPGDQVTRRLAQTPAVAAGDGRGQKDQHGQTGNADGEVGGVEACDGAGVGTQQQCQAGDHQQSEGNPCSHRSPLRGRLNWAASGGQLVHNTPPLGIRHRRPAGNFTP